MVNAEGAQALSRNLLICGITNALYWFSLLKCHPVMVISP
jgi:hypothetical protein